MIARRLAPLLAACAAAKRARDRAYRTAEAEIITDTQDARRAVRRLHVVCYAYSVLLNRYILSNLREAGR